MLQDAFIDLTLEKGYEKISVRDICARANIGRTTFYAHYLDKDDLLDKLFADFVDGLHAMAGVASEFDLLPLTWLYRHAAERLPLFRLFLSQPQLLGPVEQHFRRLVAQRLMRLAPDLRDDERALQAAFAVGGLLATMRWWVESGRPLSAENAATLTERLISDPYTQTS